MQSWLMTHFSPVAFDVRYVTPIYIHNFFPRASSAMTCLGRQVEPVKAKGASLKIIEGISWKKIEILPLPETNILPENWWWEDEFPFGFWPIFRGYVGFTDCSWLLFSWKSWGLTGLSHNEVCFMAGGWENAERTPLQARISSPLSILYIVIGVSLNIRNHKTHKTYYFSKFEKIWQENQPFFVEPEHAWTYVWLLVRI